MARTSNRDNGYGYRGTAVGASSNVKLPQNIPCCRCEKKKGHHCYAQKRLDELKVHVYKNPGFDAERTAFAACMMCTGAQQLELYCIGCERVLPNTRFAKTQRRNPDHARCMPCSRKHSQAEPGANSSDDDDSGHDGSDGGSDDFGEGSSFGTKMSNMSITDGNSGGGSLTNSSANGYGYDSASNSRAPAVSNRDGTVESTTTNGTGWMTTTSVLSQSNGITSGSNGTTHGSSVSGVAPHLGGKNGAPSTRSDGGSSGKGRFAKAAPRNQPPSRSAAGSRSTTKTALPAGAQEDDDMAVAPDSDSDDD